MAINGAMTTRQIYNLRWNNHTNNMLQVFLEQLAGEKLVDVTLSCEGKFIKVHKIVLSACSPYFEELFYLHKEPSPVIILNGVKFDDLKSVVNFMYCGEIEVAESQMEGVLDVAEALQVKGLSDVRESYENSHRKLREKDKGEGNGVSPEDTPKEMSNKPVPSKKRKLNEESIEKDTPSASTSGAKDAIRVKKDSLLLQPIQKPSVEDSKEEWNPEAISIFLESSFNIKQESLDLDESLEEGEGGGTEEIELNYNKDPDIVRASRRFSGVADERREQRGPARESNADEKCPTSDKNLTSSVIAGTVGDIFRNIGESEQLPSSTSVLYSNTARKTITTPQGNTRHTKIPRPPNAFMVFANEWRRKLATIHQGESNKDISVRLGALWKNLDTESKEKYFALARRADEEHKIRYPGYSYNPKEARRRKVLRQVAYRNSRVSIVAQVSNGKDMKTIVTTEKPSAQTRKETEEKTKDKL